jgi:hypothetical protein
MRIYVLNLARAADRRAHIERAAADVGVTLDFIEAVDGRTLTDAQGDLVDHRRRRRITPFLPSDNEIGCWLSRRRAMQALVDSGKAMAAILEDDVTLLPDFLHVLDALQHRGGLFDVVTLYRNFQRDPAFEPCRTLTHGVSLGRIAHREKIPRRHATLRACGGQGDAPLLGKRARYLRAEPAGLRHTLTQ